MLLSVDQYNPFRTADGKPNPVEALSLGAWTAISGAAFSTGLGRGNAPARSLLSGLANIRLGYWWNTDPKGTAKERECWPNLWETIRHFPRRLYRVQSLLFSEFRGRFHGPNSPLWYLSDGGHFENTGVYELIRRRVPFIIACDAGADPGLICDDLAGLVHLVRVDFGAEIEFLTPERSNGAGDGWSAFRAAAEIPDWIKEWIAPDGLGSLEEIGRSCGRHAMLARIRFATGPGPTTPCWLLVLKSSVTGDEPLDLAEYRSEFPDFPNQSTLDQSYDETQWECYRRLGEHVGHAALGARKWKRPPPQGNQSDLPVAVDPDQAAAPPPSGQPPLAAGLPTGPAPVDAAST